ncbi:MAG: hypothetical protein GWO24_11455, partial [Akkermansiaceae bacterium]|nr:hypothetical protein [Akkermansiaceae bacterium]
MQPLRSLPSFLVAAALLFPSAHSQIIAYQIDEGTVGNQDFGGALGMDFIVNGSITVQELGVFDSGSDGLSRAITVELWSRDDGGTPDVFNDDSGDTILAFSTFGVGEEGTLVGGSRFKPLAAPLELAEGTYTILAHGYGPGERNVNQGGAPNAGLSTADTEFITFVGGSRFGDPAANGQFPNRPDGGPANRYGSGTFSFTTEDTDGDGLPDFWEEANGLDKDNPDDADDDPDSDGLDNTEEFENKTDPNEADTDGDTLNDGEEVNTTMTDPTNADSDEDGLTDEVETNSGTFVSASDTGTDPNNPNTDGDFATDGEEVEAGSDPNDPNDTPPVPFAGFLAVDYLEGAPGTQTFGEGLGHDFIVNEPIRVNALGVFDSG